MPLRTLRSACVMISVVHVGVQSPDIQLPVTNCTDFNMDPRTL